MDEEAFVFGAFRLLPAQRMLLEDGKPVHLGSRALDVLVALVQSAGETLHKDQLIACAWPDTVVDEGALRVNVARCAGRSVTEGAATALSPTSLVAVTALSRRSDASTRRRQPRCRTHLRLATTSPRS